MLFDNIKFIRLKTIVLVNEVDLKEINRKSMQFIYFMIHEQNKTNYGSKMQADETI